MVNETTADRLARETNERIAAENAAAVEAKAEELAALTRVERAPAIVALAPEDAAKLAPVDLKARVNGIQAAHAVAQSEFMAEFGEALEELRLAVRAALGVAPEGPDPEPVIKLQNRVGEARAVLQQRLALNAVELGNIDMALDAQVARG